MWLISGGPWCLWYTGGHCLHLPSSCLHLCITDRSVPEKHQPLYGWSWWSWEDGDTDICFDSIRVWFVGCEFKPGAMLVVSTRPAATNRSRRWMWMWAVYAAHDTRRRRRRRKNDESWCDSCKLKWWTVNYLTQKGVSVKAGRGQLNSQGWFGVVSWARPPWHILKV